MKQMKINDLKQMYLSDKISEMIVFEFYKDKVNIFQTSEDKDKEEKFDEIDESVEIDLDDFITALETILAEAKERIKS